ncbi:MAG: hypothetical protein QJR03_04650 [Sphaerobacter sp.]|nr:hypothetical protein [Sphaerobacter sp.]
MSEEPGYREHSEDDEDLFEDIRRFLAEQAGDEVYEDIRAAFQGARSFINRELRSMEEYARMIRTLERLVEEEFPGEFSGPVRARLAEMLYAYGLAHYSLLQQQGPIEVEVEPEPEEESAANRPLVIYDLWFPQDIAIEHAEDGYYLHLSDGRIDLSLYLGADPNERGALVDLVDHWGYASANTPPGEYQPPGERITPVLTVELDYEGSELVDADDHVDILFFDHNGEPIVRMHARAGELRAIIDELQTIGNDGAL